MKCFENLPFLTAFELVYCRDVYFIIWDLSTFLRDVLKKRNQWNPLMRNPDQYSDVTVWLLRCPANNYIRQFVGAKDTQANTASIHERMSEVSVTETTGSGRRGTTKSSRVRVRARPALTALCLVSENKGGRRADGLDRRNQPSIRWPHASKPCQRYWLRQSREPWQSGLRDNWLGSLFCLLCLCRTLSSPISYSVQLAVASLIEVLLSSCCWMSERYPLTKG